MTNSRKCDDFFFFSSREDGEISEEESDDDVRSGYVKREERSRSPSDVSNDRERDMERPRASRQSMSGSFRERRWQQELTDEEYDDWIAHEYERRNPRRYVSRRLSDRDGFAGFNNPRAHSTRNQGRLADQSRDGTLGERNADSVVERGGLADTSQEHMRGTFQNGANNSQSGLSKMFKVEPFPKGIKPTEQLQEWSYWLCNFEMAIEKAGVIGQRPKAIELSLHIGEEMRRIIIAKGMMPNERSVIPEFKFYDNVVEHMERHFRSLTDESVDVTAFNSLKQGERETALEFEFRLQQLAKRMNETNTAMIRTRYIEGLRDTELRNRAFVDGISLEDTVKMATRKEAITARFTEFLPWQKDERSAVTVSAVEQKDRVKRFERRGGFSSMQQERVQGRNQERGPRSDGERCSRCGVVQHRFDKCPALDKACHLCGEKGHFRHMCTKKIGNVIVERVRSPDQVRSDEF